MWSVGAGLYGSGTYLWVESVTVNPVKKVYVMSLKTKPRVGKSFSDAERWIDPLNIPVFVRETKPVGSPMKMNPVTTSHEVLWLCQIQH